MSVRDPIPATGVTCAGCVAPCFRYDDKRDRAMPLKHEPGCRFSEFVAVDHRAMLRRWTVKP